MEALQEEVLHLRGQIALLQSEIATKDHAVVEEQTKVSFFGCETEVNDGGQRLNDLNGKYYLFCIILIILSIYIFQLV